MVRRSRLALALVLAALGLAGCRFPAALRSDEGTSSSGTARPAAGEPIRLTLVATNDLHGWVHPRTSRLANGASVEEGGIAAFSGYLKILREKNPGGVLLVDAGDLFQGTLASNVTEGGVVIDAYNALGYHAAALGNHEFDYGPVGPVSVARPGTDPFGALKERFAQARFPLLAVNIYEQATGDRPSWLDGDGTHIVELKGVRIGLIGAVTPTTPFVTNPVNVSTLRFGSLAPEVASAAARLREKGVDLVVLMVHAGGKCAPHSSPNDLSTCDLQSGEVFEMMAELPEGAVDAVVAGHTHAAIGHFVKGVPVIESYGLGRYFGTIELYVDPVQKTLLRERTRIQPIQRICGVVDESTGSCDPEAIEAAGKGIKPVAPRFLGEKVVADASLTAQLSPALAKVEAEQRRKLGVRSSAGIERDYDTQSPLGSLVADSIREVAKADFGLMNPGGLRADLPAGELTYGDVYEVMPFDNTVAALTLTGDETKRLLQAAYGARKGVFQVSGLKVTLAACPGPDRLRAISLPDGKPLKADRRYRLALPDFLARGGDGLAPVLSTLPADRIDFGAERLMREAVLAQWQQQKRLLTPPATSGRVVVLEGGPCP